MSSTSRGAPYPATSDANDAPGWLQQLATWVSDRPGTASLTTAQRTALAGADLWPGRIIFNTTTQSLEIYRSDFGEWHEGIETPGSIKEWAAGAMPAGWRKQDGSLLSRTTYAALFARIGTTYGAGDGSTTFALPNRGGRVGIDVNGAHPLGQTGGAETHTLTIAQMPAHDHGGQTGEDSPDHAHDTSIGHNEIAASDWQYTNGGGRAFAVGGTQRSSGATSRHRHAIGGQGGGQAHNNMQPFIASHFLIKV